MKLSHHAFTNTTANNMKAVTTFLLVEEQPLIQINMTVLTHDLSQSKGQDLHNERQEWYNLKLCFVYVSVIVLADLNEL